MATPTLVYCAGGNIRFVQIAVMAGFRYGARLPSTVHPEIAPLYFADQDWRKPDRGTYMRELARHRPAVATVLDWEREEQLPEVLSWAEEAAGIVETVQIIPKVQGGVGRLPRRIGGRRIVLGYSAATSYGGTALPIWDFAGWPVHILGGTPHRQMRLWRYLSGTSEVVSVDGNVIQKLARRCAFWSPVRVPAAKDRWFVQLRDVGQGNLGRDAIYEAFRRSCANVVGAWRELTGGAVG